jgi:hypothetical protein
MTTTTQTRTKANHSRADQHGAINTAQFNSSLEKTMKTNIRLTSIARQSLFTAMTIAALTAANDAAAQSPYSAIDTIRTMAMQQGPYRIEIEKNNVVVIDPVSRELLVSASLEQEGAIVMRGRVGHLARNGRPSADEIASTLAAFNLGFSMMARMELDRSTGELSITREMPVGSASSGELAMAIVRFGDLVHEERAKFRAAQTGDAPYCAVTCRPAAYGDGESASK